MLYLLFSSFNISAAKKPNIVFNLIDDLALKDLQAFGGKLVHQKGCLANAGKLFTNYHQHRMGPPEQD
ncbi:MAG: hypothetical protein CM15mP22_8450 [Gammaproteobacteria bacterium]|nr:MAG: hypothetical protein CM15mP22_8450 [Gammaproteobacteria bacterium]